MENVMEHAQAEAKTRAKPKSAEKNTPDAIALLTEDHKVVKQLFKDFEKLKESEGSNAKKAAIVEKICRALTIHTQIEEEIFYPPVRALIDDDDLMDEAEVEHAGVKELIEQLDNMEPGDDHYDAKVKVLSENVDHHVKEEHEEMFPLAKKSKVDIVALGALMAQRKKELERA